MADNSTIFREEALEHRAKEQRAGEVVRLAPRWTNWAFVGLIVLFVAAVVAAGVIQIDRYATGPVTLDGGEVVILLPSSLAPNVREGSPVEIGPVSAEVTAFRQTVLNPEETQDRYGVALSSPSVAVVTSATPGQVTASSGRVLVESDPVIVALVPGLDGLFGGD